MSEGVRTMLMRGGTSKGAYFLRQDLPTEPDARDKLLLRIMGTPDPRQIDGLGGAHPLTSKVAVVAAAADDGPGYRRAECGRLARSADLDRPVADVSVYLHDEWALVGDAAARHDFSDTDSVLFESVDDGQGAEGGRFDERSVDRGRGRVERLAHQQQRTI